MAQKSRKRRARRVSLLSGAAVALAAVAVLAFAGSGSAASQAGPTLASSPYITGTAQDNQTLTAQPGSWTGSGSITFAYKWLRCDSNGNNCSDTGSAGTTYGVTSHDVGHRLRVTVTATDSTGSNSATSDATDTVTSAASKPSNSSLPTISGTLQVNQTLTASPGSWSGTSPITFSYVWRQCDGNGNNCVGLTTGQTYKVASNDVGHRLRVFVTATNSAGSSDASSVPSDVVVAAGAGPKNTAAPKITGTAQDNQVLTVNAGSWTGNTPITFAYQWLRCDANGNNCGNIGGANGAQYKATSNDVGHRLRTTVTAKNPVGSSTATTGPTAVVAAAGPAGAIKLSNGTTSIPVSDVALPDRLVIDQVQFTPKFISTRNEQVIAKFRVVDGNGYVVRDALVYAIGVPANRVSRPAETKTDQTGWATVSYIPQKGLPIKRGARLTIFVRARKPGDSVLAGVSTRRLVSIAVHPA